MDLGLGLVEMSTYCIGSCKSIFHTITTMTYVCMYGAQHC